MKHRLSIITICYNDRVGLERTLASVFAQTAQDFEYIVVDGESTDGSVEVIERNRDRITQWVSEKDAGIYDAQNKGWRMATSPFVNFLNAGDEFANDRVIKHVLPALAQEVDIVYGDSELADHRGRYCVKLHPAQMTSAWLMKEVVGHSAQFIRTDLLRRYNGYDTRYGIAADYALFAQSFWDGGLRLRKLDLTVSVFNTEGLSSDPGQKARVAAERKAIQKQFAPTFWYWLYHTYAALNRIIGR